MMVYIKKHWKGLLVSILLAQVIGFLSNYFSGSTDVYKELTLPFLAPPGWLFGVVWPILYTFMGIAAYRIYDLGTGEKRDNALATYNMQLFFNFLWSILFFRYQVWWISALDILILDILVVMLIYMTRKIDALATYLLVPYLVWILFATYLNIAIAILN